MKNQILITLILLFNFYSYSFCFEISTPKFEKIPGTNNIRVTLPDTPGIKLIAFHGSINFKIENYQSGQVDKIITKPKNGFWSFILQNVNDSDVLYYWLYVQHNNDIYHLLDKKFEIKNALSYTRIDSSTESVLKTTAATIIIEKPCIQSITTITNHIGKICKDAIIFEDEFHEFDSSKWQREIKLNGLDDEFVIYDDKPQNLFIKNDTLRIFPTLTNAPNGYKKFTKTEINFKDRCTETHQIHDFCQRIFENTILPPIISAKIRTKNSFSFRYGRIDVRAKLPKGDWIFPQIFLEPLVNNYADERNQEYAAGQMRIAFIRSNEVLEKVSKIESKKNYGGNRLLGGVVLTDNFEYQENFYVESVRNEHLGDDYHIYSILWTDKKIKLFIDDENYATVPTRFFHRLSKFPNVYPNHILEKLASEGDMAPFNKAFYISLGVGVGGITNFPDNATSTNNVQKPWRNDDGAPEYSFWLDRNNWLETWDNEKSQLSVDFVRVTAV